MQQPECGHGMPWQGIKTLDSCSVGVIQRNLVAICFVWVWLNVAINNNPSSLPCLAKLQVDIICRHQLEHQSHERDEAEGLRMLRDAIRCFPFRAHRIPMNPYRLIYRSSTVPVSIDRIDDNVMSVYFFSWLFMNCDPFFTSSCMEWFPKCSALGRSSWHSWTLAPWHATWWCRSVSGPESQWREFIAQFGSMGRKANRLWSEVHAHAEEMPPREGPKFVTLKDILLVIVVSLCCQERLSGGFPNTYTFRIMGFHYLMARPSGRKARRRNGIMEAHS